MKKTQDMQWLETIPTEWTKLSELPKTHGKYMRAGRLEHKGLIECDWQNPARVRRVATPAEQTTNMGAQTATVKG